MTSNCDLANVTVLGFDLGHGETALTYIEGCQDKKRDIFTAFCEISAIGYLPDGEPICGEDVFLNDLASNGDSFDIGFKSKPGTYDDRDMKISDFAKAVYQKVQYKAPQLKKNKEEIETFIGCPTGWLDCHENKVLEDYKKLFIKAGIPNPKILAESNAAIAYYFDQIQSQENQNKQTSLNKDEKITLGEFKHPIIVLDFGSSTLDITIAKILGNTIALGIPLGASLIDKAILEWDLNHCLDPDYPRPKKMDEDDINELKSHLSQSHSSYAKAEFWCRKHKESYFNHQDSYLSISHSLTKREVIDGYELPICIFGNMMTEILNTPLEQLIPNFFKNNKDIEIDELAGYSWLGRCEQLLKYDLDNRLLENGLRREDIGVVVLTGGASRMQPVRDLVKKCFTESKTLSFRFDTNPELCISRGLSCYGRIDVQTRHFEQEIDAFCEDQLWEILAKHYASTKLVEIIGDEIANLTRSNLKCWRDKTIHADRIAYWIKKELRDWSQSDKLKNQIEKELERLEKEISKEVNKSLKPICEKYGLSNIDLLPSTFLRDDVCKTMQDFAEEYNLDSEDIKNESFSLVATMQELAKAIVEGIHEAWKDDEFKNLGNGWGWWRNLNFSEDDARPMINQLRESGEEIVGSYLGDEDFVKIPIYATYYSLQTVLRQKIKQAKYLIYSF
ncbi:conserved hypothetical protein [Microcystis aeruginosa PCC 9432]|jgi:hypothetical protein|uniref:Uncharacterized protein n=1 Tax=Microcystis aeruginosa PCC 9432 TaxID=1160280 RepID=A0A822L9Y1_MICAE|nr:hypothetical protein [Microcystis aeruginosa]TRU01868.1 MAG: hypothetical protein EWV62_01105 [Microcystis aeruginosa Ma_OC_LR_19540900_S633]CCH93363.1 conserved hypothetical protein [Microcystis aeruginosa PCC 9432]